MVADLGGIHYQSGRPMLGRDRPPPLTPGGLGGSRLHVRMYGGMSTDRGGNVQRDLSLMIRADVGLLYGPPTGQGSRRDPTGSRPAP